MPYGSKKQYSAGTRVVVVVAPFAPTAKCVEAAAVNKVH